MKEIQGFIDFIDAYYRTLSESYGGVGANCEEIQAHLKALKRLYLETNELGQCQFCGKVFDEPKKVLCTEDCRKEG